MFKRFLEDEGWFRVSHAFSQRVVASDIAPRLFSNCSEEAAYPNLNMR